MDTEAVSALFMASHRDLEFAVDGLYTHDFGLAMCRAVQRALTLGRPVALDVVVWSEDGARLFGGDEAVASYREDPDASVHDRIMVSAEPQGRIP
jgi:hypothetical protein